MQVHTLADVQQLSHLHGLIIAQRGNAAGNAIYFFQI